MPVRIRYDIKQDVPLSEYVPRFNFTSDDSDEKLEPATIKALLEELTYESAPVVDGVPDVSECTPIDISYLKPVLRFLRKLSGRKLTSITEKHPIADLKTIKTIYNLNRYVGMHLMALLEPPGDDSPAILDFLTLASTPESKSFFVIKENIITQLEMGFSPAERAEINAACDAMAMGETHWQETNEVVDEILLHLIIIDNDLLKVSDKFLAEKTNEFLRSISPTQKEKSLHAATYVHLRILEFVHRLHFKNSVRLSLNPKDVVSNLVVNFDELCEQLSDRYGKPILKDTNILTISQVEDFCAEHATELAKLVSEATSSTYNKRDILGKDKWRATLSLFIYLTGVGLPNEENPTPIGLVHVVAALCSIQHQRKIKSKPKKKSRKFSGSMSSPQKYLDAYKERLIPSIPLSATYIYQERTNWYVHALLARKDKADSTHALQSAQARLYEEIFGSLDYLQICNLISRYRTHIVAAANAFVSTHRASVAEYEWVPGAS